MRNTYEIRELTEKDLTQVAALEQKTFPDAWSLPAIQETFSQTCTVLFGAFREAELVGYLIIYDVAGEAEIARVAVDASCRRQGVACKMMLELENYCENHEVHKLLLDVREGNQAAIAFYKECGFTEDGLRRTFYADPVEDAVLMSRELGR